MKKRLTPKIAETKAEENRIARKEESEIRADLKKTVREKIKEGSLTKKNVEIFLARARKNPKEIFFVQKDWNYRRVGNLEEVFYIGVPLWNSKDRMLF